MTMNYILHDYEIDSIVLEDDKIIFSFPNGFYVTDDNGNELQPLRRKLVFTIDRGSCTDLPLESFLSIRRIGPLGWREISFKRFTALFRKGNMIIHDEYNSKLTNWKMIQMNVCAKWSNIEMFITDIGKILCLE